MKHLQKLGYVAIGSMLTVAIMGTALAATGQMTITVDPINIQVNGTTFAPKDAQGNSVPVFSYNGTTYAPLRALAEAYGLEVGYDSKNNMATVGAAASTETPAPSPSQAPDNTASTDYSNWSAEEEAAYQEFRGMWEVDDPKVAESKTMTYNEIQEYFRDTKNSDQYAIRLVTEIYSPNATLVWYGFIGIDGDTEGYAACVQGNKSSYGLNFSLLPVA